MPRQPNVNELQIEAALSAWRVNETNYVHADDVAAIRWHVEQLQAARVRQDELVDALKTCRRLLAELHAKYCAKDPVPAVLAVVALADVTVAKVERP